MKSEVKKSSLNVVVGQQLSGCKLPGCLGMDEPDAGR